MEKAKTWHEDDSFWETWGDHMFNPDRIEAAKDEMEKVINLLDIKPGAHVLDLCCGVGRHSLELARRGFRVTGVDRTRSYLDRAVAQAEEEKLDVEFIQEDMRNFLRADSFDCVISMYTSFSYFKDPEEDRKVVQNVYGSLKSGGSFIIETHGKETLARILRERDWNERDGVIVLQERKVSQNWSWMENRWILLRGNKRIENEISHRLYAATELMALMTGCGFSKAEAYGGIDGSPYDHTAQRLAVVGRK
ncbi:class I SAM-dependent methyltransferase [Chloroflexota bacterium]